ncbi:MAG: CobD/CbiB family protein [Proteobacteria bacterium]|nr:CobD/CbiB family protein [Pseudomonadota bacterium]HQR04057.1 CobD/CbiB family protein [Rhodocyclaceae bacterium]
MTLLSVLLALILEQFRPLDALRMQGRLRSLAIYLETRLNDGQPNRGVLAWIIVVALPSALVGALWLIALALQPVAALLLGVAMLYMTMGFRQFSHFFTDLLLALRMGELDRARSLLGEWRNRNSDRLNSGEIARLAIEEALVASHRNVFGPLLWFVLLGPAGSLLYRLSQFFAQYWDTGTGAEFGAFARRAFAWLDWLPIRVSAAGFAVAGDFEDAVYCWRTQAGRWPDPATGILIASGAGALGVRLGMPLHGDAEALDRPEIGTGDDADVDFMQSTIGIVWRTLVLGLLLLALIWVAGWVGR